MVPKADDVQQEDGRISRANAPRSLRLQAARNPAVLPRACFGPVDILVCSFHVDPLHDWRCRASPASTAHGRVAAASQREGRQRLMSCTESSLGRIKTVGSSVPLFFKTTKCSIAQAAIEIPRLPGQTGRLLLCL